MSSLPPIIAISLQKKPPNYLVDGNISLSRLYFEFQSATLIRNQEINRFTLDKCVSAHSKAYKAHGPMFPHQ